MTTAELIRAAIGKTTGKQRARLQRALAALEADDDAPVALRGYAPAPIDHEREKACADLDSKMLGISSSPSIGWTSGGKFFCNPTVRK